MTDTLGLLYPRLSAGLPKCSIADLPTRLDEHRIDGLHTAGPVLVKRDDLTNKLYGGNKVRKLEYLLQRAQDRDARRVATFGTVASNHALATALFARAAALECTCLLSHQSKTSKAPIALNMHLRNQSEIVRLGGARTARVATMRKTLQKRRVWVIPMGGSCWLGVIGFVNAALELVQQLEESGRDAPDRIYVANGTMGTVAGLAIGLALANIVTEIHAVRVTHEFIANREAMQRLIEKTVHLMRRLDSQIPENVAARCNIVYRDRFFGEGYAKTTPATDQAIATVARKVWVIARYNLLGQSDGSVIGRSRARRTGRAHCSFLEHSQLARIACECRATYRCCCVTG